MLSDVVLLPVLEIADVFVEVVILEVVVVLVAIVDVVLVVLVARTLMSPVLIRVIMQGHCFEQRSFSAR